jgi:DNA-binding NarL/FixJ family response regulator
MGKVRVLLADDHALFCSGLRTILEPTYEVIGSVGDGRELLASASTLAPDVALIDIGMPFLNGLDAGRRLKQQMPRIKIIYLTMNSNAALANEAFRSGASGYVLKNAQPSELLQAIRDALQGCSYVSARVKAEMEERFVRDPNWAQHSEHLTDRQREVLQMLAEGHSMKEVALSFNITRRTVHFHKSRIKEELGIKTDAELVQYAIKNALISPV